MLGCIEQKWMICYSMAMICVLKHFFSLLRSLMKHVLRASPTVLECVDAADLFHESNLAACSHLYYISISSFTNTTVI